MKPFVTAALLSVFVTMALSASSQAGSAASVAQRGIVKPGEPAPNFQLRDMNGRIVSLSELRESGPAQFLATWCGPCRVEMPAMERLYRTYDRKDFEILAVSTDAQGVAVTRPFQEENNSPSRFFTTPIFASGCPMEHGRCR